MLESMHINPEWYVPSDADPVLDMLHCYDKLLREIVYSEEVEYIIATGLSQVPYDRVKFYYRLSNHAAFLDEMGVAFSDVHPRMTRDFLVLFDNPDQTKKAKEILSTILVDDEEPLFGKIEKRQNALFLTLTYPNEITAATLIDAVKELAFKTVGILLPSKWHAP